MKRWIGVAAMLAMTATAYAHNGMEHVMGTLAAISASSLDVKATTGKLTTVVLTPSTQWMRGKQPIAEKDARVGERVVIHATHKDGKLVAAEVELAAAH